MLLDELAAWGVLPVAVPMLLWCAHRIALFVFPTGDAPERGAAMAVIAMALVHASVGVLGTAGVLSRGALLATLAVCSLGLTWATWDLRAPSVLRRAWQASPVAVGLLVVTLGSAVLTARLLPVWQWDAYGYHLPFVNFVLQQRGFAEVPPDLHYISTYPHNIELGMIWLRAMLPDDRLVDLAQVPYGVAGVVLTAALARRLGASASMALLAGAAWLTVPAVFLQLPTNYVDIGTAAALLGALFFLVITPVSTAALVLGGVSLGLFLGSKPAAPIAVVFVAVVAVVRGVRAGHIGALFAAAVGTLVFGSEMYVVMWLRHGNPVWPVAVRVGGFTLPGTHSVDELLAAGSALPHATGGVLERLSVSWLAIDSSPVFDMKLGGLGVLFLVALPVAIFALVRRRWSVVPFAVLATLLSPDPSIARYVLAFPALVLGLAVSELQGRARYFVTAVVLALAAFQVHAAWPGLVGDGPSWVTYLRLDDAERRVALGPYGRPTDYPPAWDLVASGESVAFDPDFEFPGLLWAPDLRYPVYALPSQRTTRELADWLDDRRVRLFAAGDRSRAVVERAPEKWARLFECRSADCTVYVRR